MDHCWPPSAVNLRQRIWPGPAIGFEQIALCVWLHRGLGRQFVGHGRLPHSRLSTRFLHTVAGDIGSLVLLQKSSAQSSDSYQLAHCRALLRTTDRNRRKPRYDAKKPPFNRSKDGSNFCWPPGPELIRTFLPISTFCSIAHSRRRKFFRLYYGWSPTRAHLSLHRPPPSHPTTEERARRFRAS